MPDRISINALAGEYKSIQSPFQWQDVPPLSILTGENGTGKTQLLEAVNQWLHDRFAAKTLSSSLEIEISGDSFHPHDVVFLPDFSIPASVPEIGLPDIQTQFTDIEKKIAKISDTHDPLERARLACIKQRMESGRGLDDNDSFKFVGSLQYSHPRNLQISVSRLFANYYYEVIDRKFKGQTEYDIVAKIGEPPWRSLNKILEAAGLPYAVTSPVETALRSRYELKLIDHRVEAPVRFADLSSGESALLRLFLLIFSGPQHYAFPRLLLLDEPDAHLHPSMIGAFLNALESTVVKDLGCRVIMTSHRSETISQAPERALFEMSRLAPRIRPSRGRQQTLGLLTDNFLGIVVGHTPVFVEDQDDAEFYKLVFDILNSDGFWSPKRTPEFIPPWMGEGRRKESGGRGKVRGWVRTFRERGVYVIRGLIDGDDCNEEEPGICTLPRYSIENYLVDPLVIAAALIDRGDEVRDSSGLRLHPGSEGDWWKREPPFHQELFDQILSRWPNPPTGSGNDERRPLRYANGVEVMAPSWLVTKRGKNLLGEVHAALSLGSADLMKAFRRIRFVPRDLADTLEASVRSE